MSVAFRRESDDEHKEPRFELPIPPGPNPVTARGLALIEERIASLDAAIATAADDEARTPLKRELRYWHTRHATAEVAPPPPTDEVGFGSRVRFRLRGAERTHRIVGGDEADPAAGLIGVQAPLARAMMGLTTGDTADFAGEADAITILAIEEGDDGQG